MALKYYKYLNTFGVSNRQPTTKAVIPESIPLLKDAKEITLAEFDPSVRDLITAHRIKDYRRRTFSLNLLPKIHTMFDDLLEGCGLNAKLDTKDHYS